MGTWGENVFYYFFYIEPLDPKVTEGSNLFLTSQGKLTADDVTMVRHIQRHTTPDFTGK